MQIHMTKGSFQLYHVVFRMFSIGLVEVSIFILGLGLETETGRTLYATGCNSGQAGGEGGRKGGAVLMEHCC